MASFSSGRIRLSWHFLLSIIAITTAEVQNIDIPQMDQLHRPHPKIPEVKVPRIEDIPISSIVIEASSSKSTDLNFIHLINPPKVHTPGELLQLEYTCREGDVMGVDVMASTERRENFRIFNIHWDCFEGLDAVQTMYVKVELPDSVAYRPDFLKPHSLIVKHLNYRMWVLSKSVFNLNRKKAYELSLANSVYSVASLMPYERPRRNYEKLVCLRWDTQILMRFREEEALRCAYESDIVQLAKYPVAMAGALTGITRQLPEFKSKYLKIQKAKHLTDPRFTISTVIYIVDYCKQHLCSILHRKTQYTNLYVTPLIFLNPKGEVHIQIMQANGQASSMLSNYRLPKHQWIRLVFSQDGKKWKLTMSHEKGFSKTITAQASFMHPVSYNDTEGLLHLGGSSSVPSFRGYMAETTIWRNRVLDSKQIRFPRLTEDMYMVGIEETYNKCRNFNSKMELVFDTFKARIDWIQRKKICPGSFNSVLGLDQPYFPPQPFCRPWGRRPPRHLKSLWSAIRRAAATGQTYQSNFPAIGKSLYKAAISRLVEGMTVIPQIIPILKQASCYDNNEASYMLSTLYSGGMGITPDRYKGIMYQLKAAEGDYPLAVNAMGDKHQCGQEGVPQDYDYAFSYFKNVADKTVKDKEKHAADGIYTEMVRLTDTDALRHQTGEKGDYFMWMKYQAKKGLAEAQINLARMLFWGQHGVTRDLPLAIQYFNEYLANNPADPLANYDMAVILLRGQGTAKNYTKALEHLNRSAELGHAPAYTALGWYALNHQRNITAAVEYFEKADKMGHRDAAHNLGYLYRVGKYPNHPADDAKAFEYYYKSAAGGHMDSGLMVAEIYNQGHSNMLRHSQYAAVWARFIAEQNVEMGRTLRKGLDAYLEGSWSESMIYYMMAAEAGVEVAQFNLAYLCEEDNENIAASYVHSDCIWKYYNKSSNSEHPPVLAQLKMGDYHWYGYQGASDTEKAVELYGKAAKQRDPQAIFNLGYIVEQGIEVKPDLLKSIGIKQSVVNNSTDKRTLSMELYRK
ncbi:protein sel-1 homolog 3-like isoform X1 [Amphiura filiformis]|uniref:protein sel-1 homolog 3-like isoform X1 n=1 Tax=Amphiura filiformis TaxID=82378 RepID=UPI003B20EEDA